MRAGSPLGQLGAEDSAPPRPAACDGRGVPALSTVRSRLGRSSSLASLAVFGAALLCAVVIYLPMWADPTHRTVGSAFHTNDPMQIMWFLKWVPWRLLHASDPFVTHAIYYPAGVSLSWNTLVPTLGLLAAPITLTVGANVSFAVLLTLAPALACLTGFWWLRRHTRHTVAAVVGGLFIGFNPFMAGHMLGHVDLTFIAAVPVMLMLSEDLLWRRPRSQRRTAVYLGLLTAAEIGVNEEIVVILAIGALFLTAAAVLFARREVIAAVRSSARYFGLATLVCLLAASPLLVSQLFLSPHVALDGSRFRARLSDYLFPIGRQIIEFGSHHSRLGGAENGVYLGPILITVLVVGIGLTARADRWVRVAALTLAALVVLSFGHGSLGAMTLPYGWVDSLPVLRSILPARFSFASAFVVAWLLVRWLDALLSVERDRPVAARLRSGIGLAAIAAAALTVVPARVGSAPLPNAPFFASASMRTALHSGEAVLLLPVPNFHDASGMYLQQVADFRFDQPGGYALRPDGPQSSASGPPSSPLLRVSSIAQEFGTSAVAADELTSARAQLQAQGYGAIIVVRSATHADRLARLAAQLTGRGADQSSSDVLIWFMNRAG